MGKIKLLSAVLVLMITVGGCVSTETPHPQYRAVVEIRVTASHDASVSHHRYTNPEKMHVLLNYLRRMETYAPVAIAPDTFRGDAFRIELLRSDGSSTVYHQIADGYLQKDGNVWEKVEPHHAAGLLRLLEDMPGDG